MDLAPEERGLPYRSFFTGRYEGTEYLRRENIRWIQGTSLLAAFDADNYNIFHWGTTILPGFAARIRELDREATGTVRHEHLLRGCPGYDWAFLRFPKPTDWQWALAEVALGQKRCTKYVLGKELDVRAKKGPLCFKDVIVPGATIGMVMGPSDAILLRKMIASQMKLPFSQERVTYFRRTHNRLILNEADVLACLKRVTKLPVDVVEWTGDTPWREQWGQMAKTVMLVSAHGSPTNHAIMMQSPGAVIEILPDRFQYVVAPRITLAAGHFYYHYMARNRDTSRDNQRGVDDDPLQTTKGAFLSGVDEIEKYRDVDISVDISEFERIVEQARDMVLLRRKP